MHARLPAKVTAVEESRVAQRVVEIVQCHRKRCLGHGGRIGEASLGVEGERRAVDVFDDLRGVYRIAGFPERGGERPVFVRVVNQGAYGDIGGIGRFGTIFVPSPSVPWRALAVADDLRYAAAKDRKSTRLKSSH